MLHSLVRRMVLIQHNVALVRGDIYDNFFWRKVVLKGGRRKALVK